MQPSRACQGHVNRCGVLILCTRSTMGWALQHSIAWQATMDALVKVLTAQGQHVDIAQADCGVIPRRRILFRCSRVRRLPAVLSCAVQQGELEAHEAAGAQHATAAGDAAALDDEDVAAGVAGPEHRLAQQTRDSCPSVGTEAVVHDSGLRNKQMSR